MVTDAKTHHEAAGQTRVEHDLFSVAVEQFSIAADVIGLNNDMRQILSHCQRELTVNFPVEMDDGSVQVFTGHRVQHNTDDLEMRGRWPALWWRQRWRHGQSQIAVAERASEPDAAVHDRNFVHDRSA